MDSAITKEILSNYKIFSEKAKRKEGFGDTQSTAVRKSQAKNGKVQKTSSNRKHTLSMDNPGAAKRTHRQLVKARDKISKVNKRYRKPQLPTVKEATCFKSKAEVSFYYYYRKGNTNNGMRSRDKITAFPETCVLH